MEFTIDKENKTVNIKREFEANRDLVWKAWTTPEILDLWWAPAPFQSHTKSMEFKVGGRRFYAMVSPDGKESFSTHEFTFIDAKNSFQFLSLFVDENGNANTEFPASDWNVQFTDENETTTVNITIKRDSLEQLEKLVEMGFKAGITQTLESLNQYFLSTK